MYNVLKKPLPLGNLNVFTSQIVEPFKLFTICFINQDFAIPEMLPVVELKYKICPEGESFKAKGFILCGAGM